MDAPKLCGPRFVIAEEAGIDGITFVLRHWRECAVRVTVTGEEPTTRTGILARVDETAEEITLVRHDPETWAELYKVDRIPIAAITEICYL